MDVRYERGGVCFLWNAKKAAEVLRRHGVSMEEAASAFSDPAMVEEDDLVHPNRGRVIGQSSDLRLLLVVHAHVVEVKGEHCLRLVTSWIAGPLERKKYREASRSGKPVRRARSQRDGGVLSLSGFLAAHGLPRRGMGKKRFPLPRKSRLTSPLGMIQERAWAFQRAGAILRPAERLKAFRNLLELTQDQLAKRSGVEQGAISKVERGTLQLGLVRARKLAKALKVPVMWLLWKPGDLS